jgi:membrane protein insertase Oxa1/YidC/SpoIIIJ
MGFISYTFGSVVAVYFIIGGLFTIVQEIYMKKHSLKKQKEV